jgi:hypothetical protein
VKLRKWLTDHCTPYTTTDGRFRIGAKMVDGSLCVIFGRRGIAFHRSWKGQDRAR